MSFIEVTLNDGDFAFINTEHITMVERDSENEISLISLSSGEILQVKESYKAIKDGIEYFTKLVV